MLLTSLFWGLLTILGLRNPTNSPPTDLPGGVSCRGLIVLDGKVSCSNDGHQTVCQVECNGKDHGEFTCREDEGWSPKLPTCAKPIGSDHDDYDHAEVAAQTGGCPSNRECNQSCRRSGRKSGRCGGKDNLRCTCQGGVSCSGLNVLNGKVSCSNDGHQTVCQVECNGKDHGEFTCKEDEGWSPELPTCARPIGSDRDDYDHAEVEAQTGGCPSNRQCSQSCRATGRRSGRCVGKDNMRCSCQG